MKPLDRPSFLPAKSPEASALSRSGPAPSRRRGAFCAGAHRPDVRDASVRLPYLCPRIGPSCFAAFRIMPLTPRKPEGQAAVVHAFMGSEQRMAVAPVVGHARRLARSAGSSRGGRRLAGWLGGLLAAGFLAGCSSVSVPEGLTPVTGFDAQRYLGKWHEIARLDHRFERGLEAVSAEYSERSDGSIRVLNRGYDPAKARWKEAKGVARFLGDRTVGSLKVSFFGPFYGGYHVIALDQEDYRYAMVSGPSRNYLWILARDPSLPAGTLASLLSQADRQGFATNALVFVKQPAEAPLE